MLKMRNMLLIGATEKNAGKTTLSSEIISTILKKYPQEKVVAIKATVLHDKQMNNGYVILEEKDADRQKDTSRLLKAGADKVFWIKADEQHIDGAIKELLQDIGDNALILCESNSIRKYVTPAFFIMVRKQPVTSIKSTAQEVMQHADKIIDSKIKDGTIHYIPSLVEWVTVKKNRWVIPSGGN